MSKYKLDDKKLSALTRRLNEIAEEEKKKYADFVDEICRKYSDVEWIWATTIASRNASNDNVFIEICKKKLFKETGISFSMEPSNNICLRFRAWLAGYYHIFRLLCDIRGVRKAQTKEIDLNGKYLIVTDCESSLYRDGKYNDRYFNDIQKYTDKELVFAPHFSFNTDITAKDLAEGLSNVDDYKFWFWEKEFRISCLKDVLSYRRLIRRMRRESYVYDGMDITEIMHAALKNNRCQINAYRGIFIYRAFEALRKKGISIEGALIWNESRNFDIMTISAIRKFFPDVPCVACEDYPLPKFSYGLHFSDEQNHSNHAPTNIAITSEYYKSRFTEISKATHVTVVPPLRMKFELNSPSNGKNKQILLVMPYFLEMGKQVIKLMNQYMKTCPKDVEVFVKNHPTWQDKKMGDYLDEECTFNYKFVDGNLGNCLKGKAVAILAYSTASMEVLFSGTYLIEVVPYGSLDGSCIPDNRYQSLYSKVYGQDEFNIAINNVINGYRWDNSELKDYAPELTRSNVEKMFL